MPTVDFTLTDITTVISGQLTPIQDQLGSVEKKFEVFKQGFEDLKQGFEDFKQSHERDMLAIQQDFLVVIDRLDSIEDYSMSTRQLVDQHSRDIMELRAAVNH